MQIKPLSILINYDYPLLFIGISNDFRKFMCMAAYGEDYIAALISQQECDQFMLGKIDLRDIYIKSLELYRMVPKEDKSDWNCIKIDCVEENDLPDAGFFFWKILEI